MVTTPVTPESARRLGRACAEAGIALVTGGGAIGLMGVAADAALAAGGRVTGIIPAFLRQREIAHAGLSTKSSSPATCTTANSECSRSPTPSWPFPAGSARSTKSWKR